MRTAPQRIPVALSFGAAAARSDAWGRLDELSALGAKVVGRAPLSKGERVFADFELAGERFLGIAAIVEDSERDGDGYCAAELRFTDEAQKRSLSKLLLELLST